MTIDTSGVPIIWAFRTVSYVDRVLTVELVPTVHAVLGSVQP